MKKKILISSIFLSAFCAIVYAISSNGGSQSDPLVTQSTADNLFNTTINEYVENSLETFSEPTEIIVSNIIQKDVDTLCFIKNDVISNLDMGDKIIQRTGSITITGTGSLINLSTGGIITNPTSLSLGVQYLIAENSNFTFTVTSTTALMLIDGGYNCTNPYITQYTHIADALSSLDLFQGTNYGYQLAKPASRIEALIMFIRLIGEEEEALAYDGSHPFTDVASWSDSYVAYAYNMGYTNGVSETSFNPSRVISDLDFYTFILRALNYEDNIDFTWATAYDIALEIELLSENFPRYNELVRDLLVLVSYKALDSNYANQTTTLADSLIEKGLINVEDYENLKNLA